VPTSLLRAAALKMCRLWHRRSRRSTARTQPAQIETFVAQVIEDYGRIDVLINNAGINIRGPIEALTLEEFRLVQDTNVTGMWLLCREVAPHMKARGHGRVINSAPSYHMYPSPSAHPMRPAKAPWCS